MTIRKLHFLGSCTPNIRSIISKYNRSHRFQLLRWHGICHVLFWTVSTSCGALVIMSLLSNIVQKLTLSYFLPIFLTTYSDIWNVSMYYKEHNHGNRFGGVNNKMRTHAVHNCSRKLWLFHFIYEDIILGSATPWRDIIITKCSWKKQRKKTMLLTWSEIFSLVSRPCKSWRSSLTRNQLGRSEGSLTTLASMVFGLVQKKDVNFASMLGPSLHSQGIYTSVSSHIATLIHTYASSHIAVINYTHICK